MIPVDWPEIHWGISEVIFYESDMWEWTSTDWTDIPSPEWESYS